MKKCLVILGSFAFVVSLSTSCIKNCKCKEYDENGKLKYEYNEPIAKAFGEKCKDYNREKTDYQNKVECK